MICMFGTWELWLDSITKRNKLIPMQVLSDAWCGEPLPGYFHCLCLGRYYASAITPVVASSSSLKFLRRAGQWYSEVH